MGLGERIGMYALSVGTALFLWYQTEDPRSTQVTVNGRQHTAGELAEIVQGTRDSMHIRPDECYTDLATTQILSGLSLLKRADALLEERTSRTETANVRYAARLHERADSLYRQALLGQVACVPTSMRADP